MRFRLALSTWLPLATLVSVEARHAAIRRDLLSADSEAFAGAAVIDANGLDVANRPHTVLAKGGGVLQNENQQAERHRLQQSW